MITMPQTFFSYEENVRYSVPSWQAFPGEFLKIEGENGAGKSSYLKVFLEKVDYPFCYMSHNPPFENKWSLQILADIFSYLRGGSKGSALSAPLDRLFEEYSAGQQNLFFLNNLLSEDYPLWVVDEGWGHLDGKQLLHFEKRLDFFSEQGGIFIYTDHENRLSRKPDQTLVIQKCFLNL